MSYILPGHGLKIGQKWNDMDVSRSSYDGSEQNDKY